MTDEQAVQHALENWQDENYICGYGLYVFNSCLGHDSYNLDYDLRELFIDKLGLISVKFDNKNATVFQNKTSIAKRIIEMEKENIRYRKLLYENKKELQAYSKALSL